MTPFIFEDGKTYYFQIKSRYSNIYHNLFCYKRIKTEKYKFLFFGKYDHYKYEQIGNSNLVSTSLNKSEIKDELTHIIRSNVDLSIPDWDGFVGNIPEDVKKSLLRNSKLNNLLDENS